MMWFVCFFRRPSRGLEENQSQRDTNTQMHFTPHSSDSILHAFRGFSCCLCFSTVARFTFDSTRKKSAFGFPNTLCLCCWIVFYKSQVFTNVTESVAEHELYSFYLWQTVTFDKETSVLYEMTWNDVSQ